MKIMIENNLNSLNLGTGTIVAYTFPEGAEIYIDEQLITTEIGTTVKTPATITDIPEGRHEIMFRMPQFLDEYRIVYVVAGSSSEIYVTMNLIPPEPTFGFMQYEYPSPDYPFPTPATGFGYIVANTRPDGAEIYLDGKTVIDQSGQIAKTPTTILGVLEGIHAITFRKAGYNDITVTVDVSEGLPSDAYAILYTKQTMRYPKMLSLSSTPASTNSIITTPVERYGDVYITTYPSRARIYMDGLILVDPETEETLKTPQRIRVYYGDHDFTLRLENYCDEHFHIYVLPGTSVNINKNLKSCPGEEQWAEPEEQIFLNNSSSEGVNIMKPIKPLGIEKYINQENEVTGDVVIGTYPDGAKIYMDGHLVIDADTSEPIETPAVLAMYMGLHNLRFVLNGYCDEFATVYVFPAGTQYIHRNFSIC